MSVATQHSPFAVGSKRLYEGEENEDHLQRLDSTAASHKRYRHPHPHQQQQQHLRGSPPGRCGSGGEGAQQHAPACAYTVGHATVAALRALFPEMSGKTISDVLAEHGDNIDAAIKHLTGLRLSTASAATPEQQAAAAVAAVAADQQEQQQQQQAQEQQAQEQQAQQGAAAGGPVGPGAAPQKSAEEWVALVVSEMAAAKDMADARARASKVLQAFEQAAVAHSVQAQAQGAGPDPERLRAQLQDVLRENQLLKRAVAIQNSRMQELGGKEAEVVQLRQVLEGFQQKVHALEMQNYSLALHLKQAADGKDAMQGAGASRNPDIF